MADTIKTSKSLDIGIEYTETGEYGSTTYTQTIKLPNFKSNITESQIKNAFADNNVLIYGYDDNNDPQYISSDNVMTASTTNQTINNIDIGWED